MISDLQCAELCRAIYAPSKGAFDAILSVDGVYGGVRYIDGNTVLALRGSLVISDWIQDVRIIPRYDANLGWVSRGFVDGIASFIVKLKPLIKGRLIITGHSLGAAHACLIAGTIPSAQLTLFGCPRVSIGGKLRGLIVASGTVATSCKNWDDLVVEVPSRWLGYCHAVQVTHLKSAPEPELAIQAHEIGRYCNALGG